MKKNVTQQLLESHLMEGQMVAGEEIAIKIDQTLTQDATGTMVMLEFEAMDIPKVKTELSVQYVDHNLIQGDYKNPDDHLFLRSACQKYGIWYSPPGNGVSHPVHMENFGIPGKTLLGSDSHSCAAGSMGMLAIGAGGLEVAMAMAGKPFYLKMPEIMGVKISGSLPEWVSAKDVILEMLRRYGVSGGVGKIIEYYGPGLKTLSAMDRHVIANMGAELGATSTVFPSDAIVHDFLKRHNRANSWIKITADDGAGYDLHEEIDLSKLEPLIACPGSPGNVVPVSEVSGREIYQAMIGSSANPGLRDFSVPAMMLHDKTINDKVSFDINPTSRQILQTMITKGYLADLVQAGGRIHQAGCNGCIGMGQAPATDQISLRTVPRNFPGRSGTKEDKVYLCSPETAAASALNGTITDPRTLDMAYPKYEEPAHFKKNLDLLLKPGQNGNETELQKGPNIKDMPEFDSLEETIKGPVLLKVGDDISTDEIMPAGSRVLPYRSNIAEISKFTFEQVDTDYYDRAKEASDNGSIIVAGKNYGQGSSREHAAIAPRYLGVKAVLAKSFARIHFQNLANFGIVPLEFSEDKDWDTIDQNDVLIIDNIRKNLKNNEKIYVFNKTKNDIFEMNHSLSSRQREMILAGSLINTVRHETADVH